MSEELTIILSNNNYYWNQFLEIIGNYCPRKMRLAVSCKLFLFDYLLEFVDRDFWCFSTTNEMIFRCFPQKIWRNRKNTLSLWAKYREIAMARMTGHQMADNVGAGSWNSLLMCGDTFAVLSMGGGNFFLSDCYSISQDHTQRSRTVRLVSHHRSAHEGASCPLMG